MAHRLILVVFYLSLATVVLAQELETGSNTSTKLVDTAEKLVDIGLDEEMFPGLSMVLVDLDSTYLLNRGVTSLETKSKVSSNTLFQLGSIGKLLTAIAVLQQIEEGNLSLEANIIELVPELKSLDIEHKVTLHCLLTHSCGLNDVNIGYLAESHEEVKSLKEFVNNKYPGQFEQPGISINYSNYSYALAGYIVEVVSNQSFETYVEENIFSRLAMTDASLAFPYDYKTNDAYARPYQLRKEKYEEATIYPRHATPPGSLVANSTDMAKFLKALFMKDSTLLNSASWQKIYSTQFTNNENLNGYSYGLEEQNINGVKTWAKGGMLQGMISSLIIVPNQFAICTLLNTSSDLFGEYFYKAVFDSIYSTNVELQPSVAINTKPFVGIYRNMRYSRKTEENIVSLFRGELRIYGNETNDTLFLYHNSGWNSYVPVGETKFQNTDLPYEFLIFELSSSGNVSRLYRNLNIGGLSVPTSYERTKWYNSPEFVNEYYGFVLIYLYSGLIFLLIHLLAWIIKLWKPRFFKKRVFNGSLYLVLISILVITTIHTYYVPFQIVTKTSVFLFGYPPSFEIASHLFYVLILLALTLGYQIWQSFKTKKGTLIGRAYLLTLELSLLIHLGYLVYWNFY